MSALDAIVRALPAPNALFGSSAARKPVIQFMPVPMTLDPRRFAGAMSNENPGGDLRPLRAFRDLVDPLPAFSTYYSGKESTEEVYRAIVNGAVAEKDAHLAMQVIAACQQRLAEEVFPDLDGNTGEWRPVYASPSDWAEDIDADRFEDVEVDLAADARGDGPYAVIGSPAGLRLQSASGPDKVVAPADAGTRLGKLRMKCLFVSLRRPWFNSMLFSIDGWRISGQSCGFCSSGLLDTNDGLMPVVPTAVLIAKDLELDAQWSAGDRAFIQQAPAAELSLGPFPVEPGVGRRGLHVVAWVSTLTPFSPQEQEGSDGSVLVANRGGFFARFSVSWRQAGRPEKRSSKTINAPGDDSIDVPAEARAITVKVEIMTLPLPETWKTVSELHWDTPTSRRIELSGTVTRPTISTTPSATEVSGKV